MLKMGFCMSNITKNIVNHNLSALFYSIFIWNFTSFTHSELYEIIHIFVVNIKAGPFVCPACFGMGFI